MTADDYTVWILGAKYKTKDGRTVKCLAILDEDRAVIYEEETDGLWIVRADGTAAFRANGYDIVDGPEVPDEDQVVVKQDIEECLQLEAEINADLEHWKNGYQEAIKDAICAAVTDATMDRHSLILFMRSLLSFYDYPMADPPF